MKCLFYIALAVCCLTQQLIYASAVKEEEKRIIGNLPIVGGLLQLAPLTGLIGGLLGGAALGGILKTATGLVKTVTDLIPVLLTVVGGLLATLTGALFDLVGQLTSIATGIVGALDLGGLLPLDTIKSLLSGLTLGATNTAGGCIDICGIIGGLPLGAVPVDLTKALAPVCGILNTVTNTVYTTVDQVVAALGTVG